MPKFRLERLVDGVVESAIEGCPVEYGHKSLPAMRRRLQRMNSSRDLRPFKNGFEWVLYEDVSMRWWCWNDT